VKFGQKVIEVATFRRQVAPARRSCRTACPRPDPTTPKGEHLIHRDNTFGTPEEDAFRRDFTINALFYDIATFSIIDYVGGLDDLRAGVVRSIGDPDVPAEGRSGAHDPRDRARRAPRLHDRAGAARVDPRAPPRDREELAAAAARGVLQDSARRLVGEGLPRLAESACSSRSRRAAPRRRRAAVAVARRARRVPPAFDSTPDTLSNAILLGSLLVPLGISLHPPRGGSGERSTARARCRQATAPTDADAPPGRASASCRSRGATSSACA
jgi:poly(A) polymerase